MPLITNKIYAHYFVESLVGESTIGYVYRATENQYPRVVALKNIRPRFARNRNALERLTASARAASALHHAHILEIFELLEMDGQFALAQEWMTGGGLDSRPAQSTSLTFETTLDWLEQCLDGLSAAHTLGIVHGNLKPSNLMFDDTGNLKLTDFGFSQMQHDQNAVAVPYSAPELVAGTPPTPRSDIYALAIIFQTLCLEKQNDWEIHFDFSSAQTTFQTETVTERVSAILAQAAAAEPENRFASAREMLDAIQHARSSRVSGSEPSLHSTTALQVEGEKLPPIYVSETLDASTLVEVSVFVQQEQPDPIPETSKPLDISIASIEVAAPSALESGQILPVESATLSEDYALPTPDASIEHVTRVETIVPAPPFPDSRTEPVSDAVITIPELVEPATDATSVETVGDAVMVEPVTDTMMVEPVSDAALVETGTDAVMVEPVTDARMVEPVTDAVMVEPVSEATLVETVTDGVIVEPVTDGVMVEPVSDAVMVEPVSDAVMVEPVSDVVMVEPVSDAALVESGTDAVIVGSFTDGVMVEPISEATLVETVTDAVIVEPVTDAVISNTATLGVFPTATIPTDAFAQTTAQGESLQNMEDIGSIPASQVARATAQPSLQGKRRTVGAGGIIAFLILAGALFVMLSQETNRTTPQTPEVTRVAAGRIPTAGNPADSVVQPPFTNTPTITALPNETISGTPTPVESLTPIAATTPVPLPYADVSQFSPIADNVRCKYDAVDSTTMRIDAASDAKLCAVTFPQEYSNGAMLVTAERLRGDGFAGGTSVIIFGYQSPDDFYGVLVTRTGRLFAVARSQDGKLESITSFNWSENLNQPTTDEQATDDVLLQIQNNQLMVVANGKFLDAIALDKYGYRSGRFGLGVLGSDVSGATESNFRNIIVGALP